MTLAELSRDLKEMLAIHEVFRRLGFEASEIFVAIYPNDVAMTVKPSAQPDKQFTITINAKDIMDCAERWSPAAEWWNNASSEDMAEVYTKSETLTRASEIVTGIVKKGIRIPKASELATDLVTGRRGLA